MPRKQLILPALAVNANQVQAYSAFEFSYWLAGSAPLLRLYIQPFTVPWDMDVSRPSTFYGSFFNNTVNSTAGYFIRLIASCYRIPVGVAPSLVASVVNLWAVPTSWPISQREELLFSSTESDLFAGGSFEPGDMIACTFGRAGSHASDTYPNSIQIPLYLVFDYYQRCQKCCC